MDPPAELKAGNYDCTTRNGRVLEGRGFTILDARHYVTEEGPGGVYSIDGQRVFFELGELDGKQIRILSTGRLKYSSDIFCIYSSTQDEFIPETSQPVDQPPAAAAPADGTAPAAPAPADPNAPPATAAPETPAAQPVPPKVIKVEPGPSDPRVKPVTPP